MENITKKKPILLFITVLRMMIGWHFLYEGLSKLATPSEKENFGVSMV